MKLVPMRFKGFEWHHNPQEISFSCEKNVREHISPFQKSYIQNTGRKNMLIRGEGELYGSDCDEQFSRLLALFKSPGSGVLAIPKLCTVHAVFESLKIIGYPKPDVLNYSFVFREVMEETEDSAPTYYTAAQGETLWDVSYLFGVSIDALVACNPGVRRPDDDLSGREVALC